MAVALLALSLAEERMLVTSELASAEDWAEAKAASPRTARMLKDFILMDGVEYRFISMIIEEANG